VKAPVNLLVENSGIVVFELTPVKHIEENWGGRVYSSLYSFAIRGQEK
jgi:hypothetical protein